MPIAWGRAAVFASLLLASTAVPAVAGDAFELKPGKARVFILLTRPPEGRPYANVGELVAGLFDPVGKGNKVTPFSGWLNFRSVDDPVTGLRWLVGNVLPGDVAIYHYDVPGLGACFNAGTVTFKVEAGKTYFAGALDPRPYILDLNAALMSHPHYRLRSAPPEYQFDLTLDHYVAPKDMPDAASQVATFLGDLKQDAAPVEMAQTEPTTFNTGYDAFHTAKLCMGYYSDKPGDAAATSSSSSQ